MGTGLHGAMAAAGKRREAALWNLAAAGIGVAGVLCLAGCGGPDFTSGMRGGGLDSGLSGGGYGGSGGGYGSAMNRQTTATPKGVYAKVEIELELPEVRGNPFDYTENDLEVTLQRPDQSSVRVPAFYDGDRTWRIRYTPTLSGRHRVASVTLNGREVEPGKVEPREFTVSGKPLPGFIRRDTRNRMRFVFDNGSVYYPLGMNVAWGEVAPIIGKAGKAGANWARVWMCHWGGANLDWVMNKKLPEGTLDLETARRWDAIIDAAENAGVYIQVVLQHHGQYSTRVNPNWSENPWNKENGGFLTTPGEFFVHPRAIGLTRAKYRYALARWGYSPNIMAWELFNEVEWTDAIANKHHDEVVKWHKGMAEFLRKHDLNKHLVTTSSTMDVAGLWDDMDYVQPHAYPSDALAVTGAFDDRKLDKPIFYGEIGPGGLKDDGSFLHRALWGSVMSRTAGAAQYWMWDAVEGNDWYGVFSPVADFVRQSGVLAHANLRPASVAVTTQNRGPLALQLGGGWASAKETEFTVTASGVPPALSAAPSFLQGSAHREMFPSLTLRTTFPEDGSITVNVDRASRAGGAVKMSVDGAAAAEESFPAAGADRSVKAEVSAKVAAGSRTIKIENPGPDWVVIGSIVLDPYAPALGTVGKANDSFGALWVHNRTKSAAAGRLTVPGMKAGRYDVVWYDTRTGKQTAREQATVSAKGGLSIMTPAIEQDLAVTFARSTGRAAGAREPASSKPEPEPRAAPREEVRR